MCQVLQDIPTRPRNGWQIYMNENLHKYKNAHNKRVLDLKEATSELSASWKAMSDAEKKVCHPVDFSDKDMQLSKV